MLLIPYIRANKDLVLSRLAIKNFKQPHLLDEVLELDDKRKNLQQAQDDLLAEANSLAKEIGLLF